MGKKSIGTRGLTVSADIKRRLLLCGSSILNFKNQTPTQRFSFIQLLLPKSVCSSQIIMQLQVLISLLPLLARFALAEPATKGPSPTTLVPFRLPTLHVPLPIDFDGPDDGSDASWEDGEEDPSAPLIEDDTGSSAITPVTPIADGLSKRAPSQLHWNWKADINFSAGRPIKIEADVTLKPDGTARFYTRANNRRRWGPYKYTVACAVQDKAKRAFTFDRTGKVCRRARSCHVQVKDTTTTSPNIKRYWQDIVKGDRILICQAKASWKVGEVVNTCLKWFKDNKEGVIAVIAIISAIAAAA